MFNQSYPNSLNPASPVAMPQSFSNDGVVVEKDVYSVKTLDASTKEYKFFDKGRAQVGLAETNLAGQGSMFPSGTGFVARALCVKIIAPNGETDLTKISKVVRALSLSVLSLKIGQNPLNDIHGSNFLSTVVANVDTGATSIQSSTNPLNAVQEYTLAIPVGFEPQADFSWTLSIGDAVDADFVGFKILVSMKGQEIRKNV